MSWDQPSVLGAFDAAGPFADLTPPGDVNVRRQILIEPEHNVGTDATQVWARLADGTPLVTARPLGTGWTILFHIRGTPDWSNLPLSGIFVSMLERLLDLGRSGVGDISHPLPPWRHP